MSERAEILPQSHFSPVLKVVFIFLFSLITICFAYGQTTTMELPKEKQTTPGLNVTAKEGNEKWVASPGDIKILDVGKSLFMGRQLKNGWINAGLPYTYQPDPKLMSVTGFK